MDLYQVCSNYAPGAKTCLNYAPGAKTGHIATKHDDYVVQHPHLPQGSHETSLRVTYFTYAYTIYRENMTEIFLSETTRHI